MHRVFYVDLEYPTRSIAELDCPIFEGPKRTWAVLPNGKRRQLGSSIFYTRPAAIRTKVSQLQKIRLTPYLARQVATAGKYIEACRQLEVYEKTGEIK